MPLLTRYILSELLKVFAVALTGITALFMMYGIVAQAVRQNLGFAQILMMLPYFLPEAMRFAVPATILFAVCSVYGRLSSSNEVVAIKSMGISPMVILWPSFAFAFLLSLFAVWLNDLAVSWGREGVYRVVLESVEDVTYSMLRTRKSYSTKQFSINVSDVEGRRLIRPIMTFQADENGPTYTVTAQEAELRADLEKNELKITWYNGVFESSNGVAVGFPEFQRSLPLDGAIRKKGGSGGPSEMPMSLIDDRREEQVALIRQTEQRLAAKAASQMMTGDFAGLAGPDWKEDQHRLQESYYYLYRLQMEPHRRWANGFSCLCFVVVGAPLAMILRRADFLSSFFACFLPILLVYYPLLLGGVDQVKSGALPSYSVWAGNGLMLLWGCWLIKRVIRY